MRPEAAAIARWRVAAGFVVAPVVGSFAFACWSPAYLGLENIAERILRTTLLVALVGGYPPTLILGVPAFLILRSRVRASLLNCTLVGLVVGSLPWILGVCVLPNPDSAVNGAHVTVEDGVRTWSGWMEAFSLVGQGAAFGAFTGVVFWLLAAAGTARKGSRSASTP